ncbi:glycine betaine ABC transporter substrate-binding protein [Paenarthrobacter sp. PH39-S1]|uniref:glycine betaine ABC transporter substrate-binding protein n=1 Tax=Paenarthrobacter sp. PH39-S1 TaxID=3046204 RepID=UPI0024B8C03B|nr:glycine betaine ABC transporter substrate-binding protein [Paenarthrobacter sp. PH39-S1]MDJ0357538.1 glycine betaine ABC transporter substrate-binding protein [Paenarthrobacter sp. PH39-S1]
MRKSLLAAVGLLSVVLTSGCALNSSGPGQAAGPAQDGPLKGATLNVGSKEFTEQLLLCEITAERLESQGATVKRTCGMSGSNAVRGALTSGAIDMYWEYTGTGWITDLQQKETITDPTVMYQKLSVMDKAKNNVVWLPPAAANNTYAVAVKTETAKKLGVSTLSDYAKLAQTDPGNATFCGASEFFGRDDGWPGLEKAYGMSLPQDKVATLAEGPIYNAIAKNNPCNFGEVFATDGRIASLGLTVLEDDKHFFPPYNLSLNVGSAVLDKNPQIQTTMEPVSKLLTTNELQKLNAQIDVDGKTPEEVASGWLTANKLK